MLYTAMWVIDVEADSPEEAAREAMRIKNKTDPDRVDNEFYVIPSADYYPIGLLNDRLNSIDLDVIDGRLESECEPEMTGLLKRNEA